MKELFASIAKNLAEIDAAWDALDKAEPRPEYPTPAAPKRKDTPRHDLQADGYPEQERQFWSI